MAAEYAIDKDAIAESLGYGYVEPLYQICSSHSRAYDTKLEARKYDPAKAKELLKQAGYKNGFKTSIIHPSPPLADKNSVAVVQAYLLAVGIEAEINMVEPAKMAQYQTATTWENALLWAGTQEHPNFNASISAFWRVGSVYFASLKRPDGWVEVTNASFTSEEVDPALMRACVEMAYNDAMVIPLSISSTLYAVNPKLHDTGFGKRGSNTMADTQNAWFSK
jgi:peptide/nickel transport system substrate-binding protein